MAKKKHEKKPKVLESLRRHGVVARAARENEVTRTTVMRWVDEDAVFEAAYMAALKEGRDGMEKNKQI